MNDESRQPRGRGAHRVIFIDLARAMAVVVMVFGHTSSALLASVHRTGPWFDAWEFQRGLTSGLFLLLSGLAFSVATTRHWPAHLRPSGELVKRLRRFAFLIVLGYALHLPVPHLTEVATVTDQQWQSFLAVDVLQLIGTTFIVVQLLVMIVRTRRVFMIVVFVLAAAMFAAAPPMWRADWSQTMPLWAASYLSPATGSQFPLFPWAGFLLMGAGIRQIYARWGAAHLGVFANWGMLLPGAVLVVVASNMSVGPSASGPDQYAWVPGQILMRTGVCLMILGLVAHASEYVGQLPRVFGAVAQESLVVYFVHLCVVYGSVWNNGLYRYYGETLTPAAAVSVALVVVVPMVILAWQWNWLKHAKPRAARFISIATAALLIGRLVL